MSDVFVSFIVGFGVLDAFTGGVQELMGMNTVLVQLAWREVDIDRLLLGIMGVYPFCCVGV